MLVSPAASNFDVDRSSLVIEIHLVSELTLAEKIAELDTYSSADLPLKLSPLMELVLNRLLQG